MCLDSDDSDGEGEESDKEVVGDGDSSSQSSEENSVKDEESKIDEDDIIYNTLNSDYVRFTKWNFFVQ